MSDKIFPKGLYYKLPNESAPDYVKGRISIKVEDFKLFMEEYKTEEGYINLDLLISKSGTGYAALNTWKPEKKSNPENFEDDIPF